MPSITLVDIPVYLRTGAFYMSFDVDNKSEVIQVPEGCFKADTPITSVEDFVVLLDTVMYWGVDDLLPVFLDFCCINKPSVWKAVVMKVADSELKSDLLLVCSSLESQSYYGPLDSAISSGRTELVRYFSASNLFPRDDLVVMTAIHHDRLDNLRTLHENGYPINNNAFSVAASDGHLSCLQYFYTVLEKRSSQDGSDEEGLKGLSLGNIMENVAHNNHTDVLEFLLEKFPTEYRGNAVTHAAWGGSLQCLKLLYAAGERCDEDFFSNADEVDLHVMRFLHEEGGLEFPEGLAMSYASDGDDQRLRYIIEHGGVYDADELLEAVIDGDCAENLKYLVEELHVPVAELIESGREFEPRCRGYLERAGWWSAHVAKKPRV